ncbi:MAG TPA: serine hydrolase domain-containing protein, partial [Gaiellaceae bacterium]|nr:serine hydrolase domain-containing protein [Gaiellaceae bacterium]
MSSAHARTIPDERSHRPTLLYPPAEVRHHQLRWLAAGLALAFAIPFGLTDLTSINRDLYYGVFIGCVFAFAAAWLARGVGSPLALLARNWRGGVALGLVFAAVMAAIVRNEPATAHPGGLDFVAAIAWRGVLYGLADGVILSAFPILAVFAAFTGGHALERWRGKVAVGSLALGVSLLFTAVYHLGYSDFRGEKLRKPLAGDVVWSVPTLATLSPLGAPIAHAGLHVSAVVHSYDTDTFLPPHRASARNRPDLQAMLDELVDGPDRLAPGATAYVSDHGDTWLGASGLATVNGEPMPTDARMRLESVSKIWTALLIHQLAEARTLRLSDTVERWLPGMLPYGDRITVAQLLVHTSGLIDNNDVARNPAAYLAQVTDPVLKAQLLRIERRLEQTPTAEFSPVLWIKLAAFQPLLTEPGTSYHYSNIGFEILGLIAARASGQSIESLYRERIFEPLGLKHTAYDPQGPISGEHARGYNIGPDGRLIDRTAAHAGIGAEGAVVSNAEDTAHFLVSLMQGKLLGPKQLALMKQGGFWSGGNPTGCGDVAYGHSGGGGG